MERPAEHGAPLPVQQWLVHEAELLDNRRYRDWLELLTDDVRTACRYG